MASSKHSKIGDTPQFPKRLFWDQHFDQIDWQKDVLSIIDRVIERGSEGDWKELVRYYGRSRVIKALKKDIKYLPDYAIAEVVAYFKVKKEELACYAKTQLNRGHWF